MIVPTNAVSIMFLKFCNKVVITIYSYMSLKDTFWVKTYSKLTSEIEYIVVKANDFSFIYEHSLSISTNK